MWDESIRWEIPKHFVDFPGIFLVGCQYEYRLRSIVSLGSETARCFEFRVEVNPIKLVEAHACEFDIVLQFVCLSYFYVGVNFR